MKKKISVEKGLKGITDATWISFKSLHYITCDLWIDLRNDLAVQQSVVPSNLVFNLESLSFFPFWPVLVSATCRKTHTDGTKILGSSPQTSCEGNMQGDSGSVVAATDSFEFVFQ